MARFVCIKIPNYSTVVSRDNNFPIEIFVDLRSYEDQNGDVFHI